MGQSWSLVLLFSGALNILPMPSDFLSDTVVPLVVPLLTNEVVTMGTKMVAATLTTIPIVMFFAFSNIFLQHFTWFSLTEIRSRLSLCNNNKTT